MSHPLMRSTLAIAGALVLAVVLMLGSSVAGQAPAAGTPRTPDGKPNLNGIWQTLNTANWDLLDHAAKAGPVVALGASFSVPAGLGVVEGNQIPYRPEMLAKKKANQEKWLT